MTSQNRKVLTMCDPNPATFLISETTSGDPCDTVTITRTYGTEDSQGNRGNECDFVIKITQPEVEHSSGNHVDLRSNSPAFPNIIEPTDLHPEIDPAFAQNILLSHVDTLENTGFRRSECGRFEYGWMLLFSDAR